MAVIIHDDEKGHWLQVFHNGEKPKSHYGHGPVAKKACAAEAARITKAIKDGKFTIKSEDEKKTLREAGTEVLVPGGHRRDSTLETYAFALAHVYSEIGDKMIGEITTKDIEKLLTLWRTDAKGSIALRLNVLNTILNHCVRKGWLLRNPVFGLEPAFRKGLRKTDKVKKRRAMSTTQLDTVLDALVTYNDAPLFYVFWLLLGRTGLRISEAMALTPDDVEMEIAPGKTCRRVLVQRAFHKGAIGPTKTGVSRYVDLSTEITDALDQVLAAFRGSGADWIFQSPRTDLPASYLYWRKHLVAATKHIRLGFKLTPHIFRHTFASQLLASGDRVLTYTSEQLGHAKPSMTLDVYGHFLPPKDAVAPVNSLDTGRASLPRLSHALVLVHGEKTKSQRKKHLAA